MSNADLKFMFARPVVTACFSAETKEEKIAAVSASMQDFMSFSYAVEYGDAGDADDQKQIAKNAAELAPTLVAMEAEGEEAMLKAVYGYQQQWSDFLKSSELSD